MNKEQVLGIIRHVLTAIGVIVVYKGYVNEEMVLTAIGAIVTAASSIWSLFDKTEGQVKKRADEFRLRKNNNKKLLKG